MNTNYIKALRNVFLAVVSPLVTTKTAVPNNTKQLDNVNELDILANATTTRNKSPMLLLKPSSDGSSWDFSGHYSHRSHRSHASHRSHYSSSYSSPSSSGSSSSSYSTGSSYSTKTVYKYNYTPTIQSSGSSNASGISGITLSHPHYSLGDRTIEPNFEGHDVTELVIILKKKGYITIEGDTTPTGELKYEGVLIKAVREFQGDYGLPKDGIVGPKTVKALKK